MDNFPVSLPSPMIDGASYTAQENTIRTSMAAGTHKMRRRYTSVPEIVTFTIRCTSLEQVQTLETFVVGTLKDVLPFNWKNFRLPGYPVAVYRFVKRPSYSAVSGAFQVWDCQLELEMLP
ncbi:MAG: hypothetical protein WKG03_14650 [Telluria sp.]